MKTACTYTVQIAGSNFDFEYKEWDDELYTVEEHEFDTLEEAQEYVREITTEQVVEWEKQADCNGLDVVIWEDEWVQVSEVGWHDNGFSVVGEKEWVGDKVNGEWM